MAHPPLTRLPEPGPRRWPRAALVIPALGLTFAGLFLAQSVVRASVLGLPFRLDHAVAESFARWLLYAALAPAVGAVVSRRPLEHGHLARRWPLHTALWVALALAHSVGMGLVYRIFHIYPRQDTLLEAIARLTMAFFGVNVVIFGAISGVYHSIRYHREALRREQAAAELRTHLLESRLDALRAQLHPHFLFNTLNAVSTLVLTGERAQVVHVLNRLGDLLRVSFDRELTQEIALSLELELLEGYLDIQRTRFGERLSVTVDIAPETLVALLPSMMLQPLVENALGHGIEARPGPGCVRIAVARRDATLCIRVEDSGPGFTPHPPSARNGIGLTNTRSRLEHLYGDRQSLECGNLPGGGAFVQVTLPFHTPPDVPVEGAGDDPTGPSHPGRRPHRRTDGP